MAGRDGMTYLTSLAVENLLAQGDASSSTAGTAGQVLVSGGADAPVSWATAGTGTLPIASTSTAGIVTTGTQSLAGVKTFTSTVVAAGFTAAAGGTASNFKMWQSGNQLLFRGGSSGIEFRTTATTATVSLELTNNGRVILQPSGTSQILAVNTGVYSAGATDANTLTMTNGPAEISGNPSTYLRITGNGLNLVIPAWTGA